MASGKALVEAPAALSKYSKRVILKTILGRSDGGAGLIGQRVVIGGWVKSSREFRKEPAVPAPAVVGPKDSTCVELFQSKIPLFRCIMKALLGDDPHARDKLDSFPPKLALPSISILQLSDGSCVPSLQVLVDSTLAPPSRVMPTGTCLLTEGILRRPSLQGKQIIEFKAEKVLHIGTVDQDRYPLSKKRVPLELLRDSPHFRPRTTTVASVTRIRNALTQAANSFCQENGFTFVQVPVITTTDCEGKSESFQVTTLLSKESIWDHSIVDETGGVKVESIKESINEKSRKVQELKRTGSNEEALAAAIHDLKKTNELVSQLEGKQKAKSVQTNRLNFSEDFFSCKTYLSGSGRLHLESYASALGNVYSFGPRFHAYTNDSKKLLAEMWTLELEMPFSQLEDSMDCAEDLLKFICKWILEDCTEDLKFVTKRVDKTVFDRLELIAASTFCKISYAEAIEVLSKVQEKKFEARLEWGAALSEEHESYLTEEVYKKPLIIFNHPKQLMPLYVRSNSDKETVAAFDLIVPKIGTLIRGSQNEERLNLLSTRIKELGLESQEYEWYLDLRRHGAVKGSGFSFLFDPLVLYATGLHDSRDAVPFPRSVGQAYC